MLTHPTAPPPEKSDKNAKDTGAKEDKAVECPRCHAVFPESQLITPAPPLEFPRLLYKLVAKPKPPSPDEPEEELQTRIANNEEELKKDESEGWQKDVPQPKKDDKSGPKQEPKHEEPKKK